MKNTAKCYRESCSYMKNNHCDRPNGSCGGSRWTRKPKITKVNKKD